MNLKLIYKLWLVLTLNEVQVGHVNSLTGPISFHYKQATSFLFRKCVDDVLLLMTGLSVSEDDKGF